MITDCQYKITTFNKISRIPRPKCKRNNHFIIHCIDEDNCEYVKEQNRILKKQIEKRK